MILNHNMISHSDCQGASVVLDLVNVVRGVVQNCHNFHEHTYQNVGGGGDLKGCHDFFNVVNYALRS